MTCTFSQSRTHSKERCSVSGWSLVAVSVSAIEEFSELAWITEWDSGSASNSLDVSHVSELGSVSLESLSLGTSTSLGGANSDDTGVDGAGDAVLELHVDLWQTEVLWIVGIVVFDISSRGEVNHLSHLETLDSFILWHAS